MKERSLLNNIIEQKEVHLHYECASMSSKELGEALVGCSELFGYINEKAGNQYQLNIIIQTLSTGSIKVSFLLELIGDLKNMILSENTDTILRSAGLISICSTFFSFFKRIKDKVIDKESPKVVEIIRKIVKPIINRKSSLSLKTDEEALVINSAEAEIINSYKKR